MRANIAKSSLFGWKWAINKMRNHVDCGWLQKEGFTQFHCREHVVIRISCIRLYNWVCRYKKIILKAKRNCNFNFRLLYGDALRCAVLCCGSVLVYHMFVLSYIHILFITIYFTFSSCTFFIQFRSCYLHNTHHPCTRACQCMYFFFRSYIRWMQCLFAIETTADSCFILLTVCVERKIFTSDWFLPEIGRTIDYRRYGVYYLSACNQCVWRFSILIKFSKFKC